LIGAAPIRKSVKSGEVTAAIGPAEVQRALERIVRSAEFRNSLRLTNFLKYVVDAALGGATNQIKSYTIATEALGRDTDFDPQADPIVRVEARRLRDALARYYGGTGRDDPIVIELPRGGYVPVIRRRSAPAFAAGRLLRLGMRHHLRLVTLITVVAAITSFSLDMVVMTWDRLGSAETTSTHAISRSNSDLGAQPLPAVAVSPLEFSISANNDGRAALTRLREKLRDAIALDDNVVLVAEPSPPGLGVPMQSGSVRTDYRISIHVEENNDGTADLAFRLTDEVTGTVPWTRTFPRFPAAANSRDAEDMIVRTLVGILFRSNGVIYAFDRSQRVAGRRIDPRYGCLLEHYELSAAYDPGKRARVRSCLEHAMATDPNFALGYVSLAEIDMREYVLSDDVEGAAHWLERSLNEAQRAVELDPESPHAHLQLMWARYMYRDIAAAITEGTRAAMLDPYDTLLGSDLGTVLLLSGQYEKGYAMVKETAAIGAEHPLWMNFALFFGAYLTGDIDAAGSYAAAIRPESHPQALFARALAAAKSNQTKLAHDLLERLQSSRSAWVINPRQQLEKLFADSAIVSRLSSDLANIAASAPTPNVLSDAHFN
jgi:hypothetical protein